MSSTAPPEVWSSFLREIDSVLGTGITLHCISGFVLDAAYGLQRSTADLGFLATATARGYEREIRSFTVAAQ